MAAAQAHRGPDSAGSWSAGPVALAHRRLAVIDLSPAGAQPLPNEDGSIQVVFNGELYNWPEVRPGLIARGHAPRGHSDAEMLVHLWEEKGEGLLADLRGMFAFALFDTRRRELLLARDRLGQKPLYYHDDGRRLAFASELKGLLADPAVRRDVDPAAVVDFLAYRAVPGGRSILRGVRKLPPGHLLRCDAGGVRVEPYWRLPLEPDAGAAAEPGAAARRLRALLDEAVRIRMRADVPLGALLSGGVDSGAVVALMARASGRRVRTFSIGLEGLDTSELPYARAVAAHCGTEHHELVVRADAVELLPRLAHDLDEPLADDSILPTWLLSRMAREHVTVALSGDGGDEAFGGYTTYAAALRYARWDRVPRGLRRLLRGLGPGFARAALDPGARHLGRMTRFTAAERAAVLDAGFRAAAAGHDPDAAPHALWREAAAPAGPLGALLALDTRTYLPDVVLVKVDRASMLHALEVRSPLLDHVVQEYAARLPVGLKLRGPAGKWVLREAVRDLLPPAILDRPKQGFGVPLAAWFRNGLGDLAREVLLDRRARDRGWLDPAGVGALLARSAHDRDRAPWQVFSLLSLELWARAWVDAPAAGGPSAGATTAA